MAGRNPFDKTPRRGRPPKQPPKMSVGRPSNAEVAQQLGSLAERSMQLQATIQEGALTLSSNLGTVFVEPLRWK